VSENRVASMGIVTVVIGLTVRASSVPDPTGYLNLKLCEFSFEDIAPGKSALRQLSHSLQTTASTGSIVNRTATVV
jgi:hypothetical protein